MIVVAFGVFLIGLAGLIAIKPRLAERFLRSFASSARAHYTEQALRLIAGGALVSFAPSMLPEPVQVLWMANRRDCRSATDGRPCRGCR